MKKGAIILIATIVISKLFATSMLKLFPESTTSFLQNPVIDKIVHVISSHKNGEGIAPIKTPVTVPTKTKEVVAYKALPVPPQYVAVAEKKAQRVESTEEEKKRRKKRKKKLEEAANKNNKAKAPTFTVQKNQNADEKRIIAVAEGIGPKSLLISTVDKKEAVVQTPVTAAAKINIAQWAKLLSENPTAALMKTFLGYYKAKQITAKEYYSVIAQMQKSPKKDVRSFAIKGASTEANSEAFQILVHSKYSETDTDLQSLTVERLQVYKDLKYLSFLAQSLTSGDVFAKIEASDLVGQITLALMASPQDISNETKRTLSAFVNILTPLTKDPSAQLQAMSTKTLNAIKQVLGIKA